MSSDAIIEALDHALRQLRGTRKSISHARGRMKVDSDELRLALLPGALLAIEKEVVAVKSNLKRKTT